MEDWDCMAPLSSAGEKRPAFDNDQTALPPVKRLCSEPWDFGERYGDLGLCDDAFPFWDAYGGTVDGSLNSFQAFNSSAYPYEAQKTQYGIKATPWLNDFGSDLAKNITQQPTQSTLPWVVDTSLSNNNPWMDTDIGCAPLHTGFVGSKMYSVGDQHAMNWTEVTLPPIQNEYFQANSRELETRNTANSLEPLWQGSTLTSINILNYSTDRVADEFPVQHVPQTMEQDHNLRLAQEEVVDGSSDSWTGADDQISISQIQDEPVAFTSCQIQDTKDSTSQMDLEMEDLDSSITPVNSGADHCDESKTITTEEPITAECDVCFGAIEIEATSSVRSDHGNHVPVNLKPTGDILRLYVQDSNEYAGISRQPALAKLVREYTVQLSATLVVSEQDSKKPSCKKTKTRSNGFKSRQCSVRIIIHGLTSEKSAIGTLLSDAGIFFQEPYASECNADVEYSNPHYLVRPGSSMPALEYLSIVSDTQNQAASEILDEVQRTRFMRIFDCANDVETRSNILCSPRLSSTLKDHQLTAVSMMFERECGVIEEALFPLIWELDPRSGATESFRHKITLIPEKSPKPIRGGILADEMGLGKTLSIMALICSSLDGLAGEEVSTKHHESTATLIVVPKSTIPGWIQQISEHIRPGKLKFDVYHGSSRRRLDTRLKSKDVIITTYETLRSDWMDKRALYAEKWYRVVLDEAHHIRNRCSQTFQAAYSIQSRYRWCVTGTPIQNSLDDYGALLSFLRVPAFQNKSAFDLWIATPLKQEQPDSFKKLQDLVKATCLRRTKQGGGCTFRLPRSTERIEPVRLQGRDQELYRFFQKRCAEIAAETGLHKPTSNSTRPKGKDILILINFLRLICDHGERLLPASALEAWKARDRTLIDWAMIKNSRKTCCRCGNDIEDSEGSNHDLEDTLLAKSKCADCAVISESNLETEESESPASASTPCDTNGFTDRYSSKERILPSAKVEALLQNIRADQALESNVDKSKPRKSVVFSYWTKMLDLIQVALEQSGYRYQRIDGRTSLKRRGDAISQFNNDPACTVMLASIGSAGEGVDLKAASSVHLIEPHWNPMAEAQAVARIHRIGQMRDVLITRYIAQDTIETYIQWVQAKKLSLISRSIDAEQVTQSEIEDERWEKLRSYLQ